MCLLCLAFLLLPNKSLLLLLSSYRWFTVVQCINSEKAMAPHSSTLAWKIPWTEEPGKLQSMGSPRVRHNWTTSLSLFTFMHWRRKWQPTPVFLPGESQGWWSLVGCRLWGRTESDTWLKRLSSSSSGSVLISWAPNSLQMVTAAMKLKDSGSFKEKLWPT